MNQAKQGDQVKVNYTGTLIDGTVFDSSVGHQPLAFTIGGGQVIAGFEEAVIGMTPGESKRVAIPEDKAYGPHRPEMLMTVPASQVPPDLTLEKGQQLEMGGPNGELLVVRVIDLNETEVTLDANPPLAGKELIFEIELVAID